MRLSSSPFPDSLDGGPCETASSVWAGTAGGSFSKVVAKANLIVGNNLRFGHGGAFTPPVTGTQTGQPEKRGHDDEYHDDENDDRGSCSGSCCRQRFGAELQSGSPDGFPVGNKTMAPGSYDLRLVKGAAGQILVIYNQSDHNAAALVGSVGDPAKASRDATVTFECTDGTCSLRKLSGGSGTVAYQFPAQKAPGTLTAHRTEFVTLSMIKAH